MLVPFFFFQAEDGIRDVAVTGVQTCALPIWRRAGGGSVPRLLEESAVGEAHRHAQHSGRGQDRKSTRLNSSHGYISYAVFCLKKKKKNVHTAIAAIGNPRRIHGIQWTNRITS